MPTGKNLIGKIVARFEEEGLRIAAMRKVHLSQAPRPRASTPCTASVPSSASWCEFMSSVAPCVVMVLEGENAVAKNREIMGATNPAEAADGTLRKLYADSIGENAVHGSDSPENAVIEINYFFRGTELY